MSTESYNTQDIQAFMARRLFIGGGGGSSSEEEEKVDKDIFILTSSARM
jgi:hypothetical protein